MGAPQKVHTQPASFYRQASTGGLVTQQATQWALLPGSKKEYTAKVHIWPLTDLTIRQAKPQDKPYHMPDGDALYLEVTSVSGKHWLFRYRFNGKPAKLVLGKYPAPSQADARGKAPAAHRLLAEGAGASQLRIDCHR